MLKHRFFISFFITTLLYASLGMLFFYGQNIYVGTEQIPQEKSITFSLAAYEPEVKKEDVVEEKEIIEPELEPEPLPKKVVIPEPIIPKVRPKPQPIVKKITKKPLHKKRKKIETPKKRVKKTKATRKPSVSKKVSPAKRNRFLAQIRRKINTHKSYPRIAQRRGMMGSVKVKFTILSTGNVANIKISGPKIFHNSARNAVKKAFPIHTKNAPISLPTQVNITLRYQIK